MDPNENEMNNVAQYLDSLVTTINPGLNVYEIWIGATIGLTKLGKDIPIQTFWKQILLYLGLSDIK
ncbi:1706_t:CDS:2 [Rhizophagus irregularis]|nr:1706_t:CDS:2 [Rhizophagus irregularis]